MLKYQPNLLQSLVSTSDTDPSAKTRGRLHLLLGCDSVIVVGGRLALRRGGRRGRRRGEREGGRRRGERESERVRE